MNMSEILTTTKALLQGVEAVSYTHLDVYKRQGKEVTVLNMGEPFIAKAVDIDNDAHLIVKTADERYLTISSGEVTLQGDWK